MIIGLCEHTWHLNARLALLKMLLRIFKAGENFIDTTIKLHGPHRLTIGPVLCRKGIGPDTRTMSIDDESSSVYLTNSFVTKMDVRLIRVNTDRRIS